MGVRHIMTCFDMDYLKNWHVESAYQNLVELLAKQNVTFGILFVGSGLQRIG